MLSYCHGRENCQGAWGAQQAHARAYSQQELQSRSLLRIRLRQAQGPVAGRMAALPTTTIAMTTVAKIPVDPLAELADAETQRLTARMAQDIFAGIFRQAVSADAPSAESTLAGIAERCRNWCRAAGSDEAGALRLAMLIGGLDQWGLAYSQAFRLNAIPALTSLVGALRTQLAARDEALFQAYFAQIDEIESAAIDFKIELRRSLHLALWHAVVACETAGQAEEILQPLGSMMLALDRQMPELGWRLLADALASIQIGLLAADPPLSPGAQAWTQQLFASLAHALPRERYQAILAHSGQVVLAWQRSTRG